MLAIQPQMSAEQAQACEAFRAFMQDPDRKLFRLDGPAGSGKTWLAIQLARIATEKGGYAMYGAYTGKAAEVLRSKGCHGAQTLHSMAYVPLGEGDSWDVERMQKELNGLQQVFKEPTPQMMSLAQELEKAKLKAEDPQFGINFESTLWGARILVIDEHSMVDEQMGNDLLSFGVKILALGDQFQLPPVDGPGFFERGPPDFELTEIHRQAEGSPVLYLAGVARRGNSLPFGEFEVDESAQPDSLTSLMPRILPSMVVNVVRIQDAAKFDQVLVGKNRTRMEINAGIREVLGYNGNVPMVGEKLICLRNSKRTGARNGTLWTVKEVGAQRDSSWGPVVALVLESEDGRTIRSRAWAAPFNGEDMKGTPFHVRSQYEEFTYGYAITVHKSQGSQWDTVLLIDESRAFREDEHRHRYTGITRAAKRIIVARGIKP